MDERGSLTPLILQNKTISEVVTVARARSPDSIEAERLYHSGMKLVDIAKKLGIPDGTVRRWKSTQKWDANNNRNEESKTERSHTKKPNVRKSKGAPRGNKNAVGHAPSVPERNKNAEKHGAFSTLYLDALDEDEISLIHNMGDQEEDILKMQIGVYSVRERHLMHKIKEFENSLSKGLYVKGTHTKKHSVYGEEGKSLPESMDVTTETEHWIKGLVALQSELTKVQRAKTKCVDSLMRLRKLDDYDNVMTMKRIKQEEERISADEGGVDEIQIYIPNNGRD